MESEALPTERARIDPRVDIGHVHLKVSDLDRALGFYCDVLGFELQQRMGSQAAFISAGGYHHHIGLNTWESAGAPPPPRNTTGLFHAAIRYPDRRTLADAVRRVLDAGIQLDGASDHGVSEALYLRDPDGNGVELYRDRPSEEWPRSADGDLIMVSDRLDVGALLQELDATPSDDDEPASARGGEAHARPADDPSSAGAGARVADESTTGTAAAGAIAVGAAAAPESDTPVPDN